MRKGIQEEAQVFWIDGLGYEVASIIMKMPKGQTWMSRGEKKEEKADLDREEKKNKEYPQGDKDRKVQKQIEGQENTQICRDTVIETHTRRERKSHVRRCKIQKEKERLRDTYLGRGGQSQPYGDRDK